VAVSPDLLLDSARVLAEEEAEINQRNAASRAYYAAFHRCLPIARRLGLPERPERAHRDLIDTLTSTRDTTMMSIGYRLNQCRLLRVHADYEISTDFTRTDSQTALSQCERIMRQADAVDPSETVG
jgi:uncharacterized protein (UPF0332 family)